MVLVECLCFELELASGKQYALGLTYSYDWQIPSTDCDFERVSIAFDCSTTQARKSDSTYMKAKVAKNFLNYLGKVTMTHKFH
jgi:hypothetical protein